MLIPKILTPSSWGVRQRSRVLNASIIAMVCLSAVLTFVDAPEPVKGCALLAILALSYLLTRQFDVAVTQTTAALNNMPHALCMFDAKKRLVLCNDLYIQLYRLPPELRPPRATHDALIAHRIASGLLATESSDDPVANKLAELQGHSTTDVSRRVDKLTDGREILVTRRPLAGNGWVATHEDITERRQFERQREALASQEARRTAVEAAISTFRERVSDALKVVSDGTQDLKTTARGLFRSSEQTSEGVHGVVKASQAASANVENAAAATDQMSASIREISDQINQAASVVRSAVNTTKVAHETFVELTRSAERIGAIVKLIQEIAEQTNLLGLNATIEAARAGAAGRGFGVVASEVKSLAVQTAKATEDIASQIEALQVSAHDAVKAIGSIEDCMNDIHAYTTGVATSVEEQSVATSGIFTNVATAAQETAKIVAMLNEVTAAAVATRASAENLLAASKADQRAVASMQEEIEGFLHKVAI
jgi:methyl-accepting chemotaxis protein